MRTLDRHSIGTKIFAGFLAAALTIALLGAYGYVVLSRAGDMVAKTYDGPMMAINFARAADVDFLRMRNQFFRKVLAPAPKKRAIQSAIDDLASTFSADLDVAQERSDSPDEISTIHEIRGLVAKWVKREKADPARAVDPAFDAFGQKIIDRFDDLIEYNADNSFIGRRKAVWAIERFENISIGGIVFGLLLVLAITQFLARLISRPLSSAARVAERIARGELHTEIPDGGKDETGTLLATLRVMQDNIRQMVAREQARAQSAEARLADALENAHEGILLFGADGRILTANSQLHDFFPAQARQLMPGNDFTTAMTAMEIHFAQGAVRVKPLVHALRADKIAESANVERQLADGRWLRLSGSRTSEDGLMVLVSDFTNIKQREEDYRMAKIEAEAASAAKSRFLANMSHELRTPLNAIIGFSEVIAGEMFGALTNKKYLEYAADILRSGKHLLDVVNSVLDLAKSESGKMALHAEIVDLRFVLMDCAKMMREQCAIGGLKLTMPEMAAPLPVAGEKAKLRQIFLNLLSNAIKFTERGGEVSVGIDEAGGDIVLTIADTGIGMSAEDIRVALTPFGQVDNRLERRYEGTGLGLPLTKAFVELHRGTLNIESEPGKGTKVFVRLARTEKVEDLRRHENIVAA
jgi:signal transduction histidine kinase/HAMP domain-containing protein